ncbi:hypothetical protein EV34_14975, partial [Staphylococcus aureus]
PAPLRGRQARRHEASAHLQGRRRRDFRRLLKILPERRGGPARRNSFRGSQRTDEQPQFRRISRRRGSLQGNGAVEDGVFGRGP